jgi:hypothetical protein
MDAIQKILVILVFFLWPAIPQVEKIKAPPSSTNKHKSSTREKKMKKNEMKKRKKKNIESLI